MIWIIVIVKEAISVQCFFRAVMKRGVIDLRDCEVIR